MGTVVGQELGAELGPLSLLREAVGFLSGLWGMEPTSVIQQKGPNPKDDFVHKGEFPKVSQKWLEKPLDP